MSNIKADEIKRSVSLVTFLSKLGYEPVFKTGKERMYLSMLRSSDTDPSFSVNDTLGLWYDHGAGKGGNIVDFGILYFKELIFDDVLNKIISVCNLPMPNDAIVLNTHFTRPRRVAVKIPNYQIEEIKHLGTNQVITNYLEGRGVWGIDNNSLREIYYYVEDEKKNKKRFFAVGWLNEKNTWEVRNKYFKGSLGTKALTFIKGDPSCLLVFEGYMNYLSWKRYHKESNLSVVVLNSLSTLNRAISIAQGFVLVYLYLDHDPSGITATQTFTKAHPRAVDNSIEYQGYNDYNDKLKDEIRTKRLASTQAIAPSKGGEDLTNSQTPI